MVLTSSEIEFLYIGGFLYRKPIPGYSRYTITIYYNTISKTFGGHVNGKKGHITTYYNKYRKKYYTMKNDKGKLNKVYFDDLF